MTDLRLYLFGTPRLEFEQQPIRIERRKALALAAYLALSEQQQSRDVVAALLWPDLDDAHARSALRSALRALTTAAPVKWIEADRMLLRLNPEQVWVDTRAFTSLLSGSASHGHPMEQTCEACVALYEQATNLYRGDFLTGFHLPDSGEYQDWQLTQREWLRREFADVQQRLSCYHMEAHAYREAIRYGRQWLALDPLHEAAHRHLMRLYWASGQRSEALRQYQQCVELLDAELASPPEGETTQLFEAIQQNEVMAGRITEVGATAMTGIMPPLPSLVVGREEALQALKRRTGVGGAELRAVTVIQGWPGVGKSTLVAALAHDSEITRQFPDGILWASLGETPELTEEVMAWAEALKVSEPGRVRKIDEVSAQMTAALHGKRTLLIVDDVWQAEHALPFRVGGQACAMVLTTRFNDAASALAPTAADVYRLPVLSETDGLALLQKLTPETVVEYPDESAELVSDLEGLPLAIHVAGRLLHSETVMGWGVKELLAELRSGAGLLQAQAPKDMLGVSHETSPTVAALLKRSTDLLDAETRYRFAFLGLFVPKPATFDLEAMAAAWNVGDPKPTARTLVNRGLLEPVSGGRFQMHALLVLHARWMLEQDGSVT